MPQPALHPAPGAVFVYGTLKSGEQNHRHALESGLLGVAPAFIEGYRVYDLEPEHYPALVRGQGRVYGEVLSFADLERALVRLDWLEAIHENPPEYRREEDWAQLESGARLGRTRSSRVWVYLYLYEFTLERPGATWVQDGVWRGQFTPRRGASSSSSSSSL